MSGVLAAITAYTVNRIERSHYRDNDESIRRRQKSQDEENDQNRRSLVERVRARNKKNKGR
jgi:hypothetical protein